MKKREAVYTGGMMAGIILGTFILRPLGFNNIIVLIGGIVIGIGVGMVAEQTFCK